MCDVLTRNFVLSSGLIYTSPLNLVKIMLWYKMLKFINQLNDLITNLDTGFRTCYRNILSLLWKIVINFPMLFHQEPYKFWGTNAMFLEKDTCSYLWFYNGKYMCSEGCVMVT